MEKDDLEKQLESILIQKQTMFETHKKEEISLSEQIRKAEYEMTQIDE